MKPSTLITAPAHLTDEAKSLHSRITKDTDFDPTMLLILEGALEAFDRMRAAQAVIKTEGITTLDRHGQARAHPAVAIERDSRAAMLRQLKALGLDLEPLSPR